MPILLGQVAVIVLILTIGTFTNWLGAIRENRTEFEAPEINLRSGGSLGTNRQELKRLPAPRGYKKSVARLGATRVGARMTWWVKCYIGGQRNLSAPPEKPRDAIRSVRHWGCRAVVITHETHLLKHPSGKIALVATCAGRDEWPTR